MMMDILWTIGIVLAAIGALNWGLVALFNFDLVAVVTGAGRFGQVNQLSRMIYLVVALAGIIALIALTEILGID